MEEKFQKKELMNDLYKKDMRIQSLEGDVSHLSSLVDKLQRKLDVAMEGLKHIHAEENWVIAKKCLDEIYEA